MRLAIPHMVLVRLRVMTHFLLRGAHRVTTLLCTLQMHFLGDNFVVGKRDVNSRVIMKLDS